MEINVLLFSDFETLDAFGPVEMLGRHSECHFNFVSSKGGTIHSRQGVPVETCSLDSVSETAVLLIPGGKGTRPLVEDRCFLERLRIAAEKSEYCLTVCTGSGLLAKTGLLDDRKATSNKRAMDWAVSVNPKVDWQYSARWVIDGKYYTSSGISAGMDMALGFLCDQFGLDVAEESAASAEYLWNQNREEDPFSVK
ncbi:DJ-1/PfpI family protein [Clostridium merdae]|uniref:DJ-1/PfpI family protein n=1 Tax=Clostridium merdae TaxID=1958780 RepID=UPI000A26E27D|nr:DJ-1/PfpI family protein [Clostridium merdae]